MAFPLSLNLVPPQMLRENPLGQSMQEMLQNLCTLITSENTPFFFFEV